MWWKDQKELCLHKKTFVFEIAKQEKIKDESQTD
jgi:hypothetical protein